MFPSLGPGKLTPHEIMDLLPRTRENMELVQDSRALQKHSVNSILGLQLAGTLSRGSDGH